MKWAEIAEMEDCDLCPVKKAELCTGGYSCYGGAPVEPPCCSFDDDTDVNQWVNDRIAAQYRYEAWEDAQIRKKEARQERAKKAAETRRELRRYCREELHEIKRLEKALSAYEAQLRLASTFAEAFNATNEMFRYSERMKVKPEVTQNIEKMKSDIAGAKERYSSKRQEFYAKRKAAQLSRQKERGFRHRRTYRAAGRNGGRQNQPACDYPRQDADA